MKADRRKLPRLRRLERLREAERLIAARDAAQCEDELARVSALGSRSEMLRQDCTATRAAISGADLRAQTLFAGQIDALARQIAGQHAQAESGADSARLALTSALHRRDRVAERADSLAKELNSARNIAAHGTSRNTARNTQSPSLARKLNS